MISQITEFVYLGSCRGRDPLIREKHNIQHVISILTQWERDRLDMHPVAPEQETEFILDDSAHNEDLPNVITAAVATLEEHVQRGEVVLVHCMAGVSRSATVVIAWLMKQREISFTQALEEVKRARPLVRPNATFCAYLARKIN